MWHVVTIVDSVSCIGASSAVDHIMHAKRLSAGKKRRDPVHEWGLAQVTTDYLPPPPPPPPPPHPQPSQTEPLAGFGGDLDSLFSSDEYPGVPVREPCRVVPRLLFPISCFYFIFFLGTPDLPPGLPRRDWGTHDSPFCFLYTCIHSILSPPCFAVVLSSRQYH